MQDLIRRIVHTVGVWSERVAAVVRIHASQITRCGERARSVLGGIRPSEVVHRSNSDPAEQAPLVARSVTPPSPSGRGGTTLPRQRAPRSCTVFVMTPPNEHTSEGGRDDRGVPYHAESTLSSAQVLKQATARQSLRFRPRRETKIHAKIHRRYTRRYTVEDTRHRLEDTQNSKRRPPDSVCIELPCRCNSPLASRSRRACSSSEP